MWPDNRRFPLRRISGTLLVLTCLAQVVSWVFLLAQSHWLGLPSMPGLDRLGADEQRIIQLHAVSGAAFLGLVGAYAGAIATAYSSGIWGRLAAWNGLALFFAIFGYLFLQWQTSPTFDTDMVSAARPKVLFILYYVAFIACLLGAISLIAITQPKTATICASLAIFALIGFLTIQTQTLTPFACVLALLPLLGVLSVLSIKFSDSDTRPGPLIWSGTLLSICAISLWVPFQLDPLFGSTIHDSNRMLLHSAFVSFGVLTLLAALICKHSGTYATPLRPRYIWVYSIGVIVLWAFVCLISFQNSLPGNALTPPNAEMSFWQNDLTLTLSASVMALWIIVGFRFVTLPNRSP